LCNLALLYRQLSRFNDSEPLYLRALRITERQYGPDHSWSSKIRGNLAQLYQLQGRFQEAQPLFDACLAALIRSLGLNHIDTATTMTQLAQLYVQLGTSSGLDGDSAAHNHFLEASRLYAAALTIRERMLGVDHYTIGKIWDKLAVLEWKMGNKDKSALCQKKALSILEDSLGSEHPYVHSVRKTFASLRDR